MELLTETGLGIYFDPQQLHISFVDGKLGRKTFPFQRPEYSVRTYGALKPILEDPTCVEGHEQEIVYWMFRNLGLQGQEHMVRVHSLRYDLSVFRQHRFGQELMKTSGHYHPDIWAGGLSYPEVYEVAYGTAIFLLQEVDDIHAGPKKVRVRHCIALECRQGEKAIMPPNFGHVTLNPDPDRPLITTNWVCSDFASVYGGAESCRGFAWYRTEDRGWVPNPNYACEIPPLRHARCADVKALGLQKGVGIYPAGCRSPELFAWLKRPQDYLDLIWQGIAFEAAQDQAWKAEYVAQMKRRLAR